MQRSHIQTFRTLLKIEKTGSKRQSGQDVKLFTKIIRYIFLAFTFIAMLFLAVVLIKSAQNSDFDINLFFNIGLFAVVPFLLYDFVLRLTMPIDLHDELFLFYILPIPKKTVALCKSIISLPDMLLLVWFSLLIPIYGAMNYLHTGIAGIFYSFILALVLLSINKQINILFRTRFNKKKLLTILVIILFYGCLIGFALLSKYLYAEEIDTIQLTNILFPSNFGYFILALTLLLVVFSIPFYFNVRHLIHLQLDDLGESDKDILKSKSVGKSTQFERFGKLGKQVQNDLLFLLRNKKLRIILAFIPFSLLFIFLGLTDKKDVTSIYQSNYFWFVYPTILSYLTFAPYEATYFELYATKKSSWSYLLKSKYIIISIIALLLHLIALAITIPYGISTLSVLGVFSLSIGIIPFTLMQIYVYNTIAMNPTSKKKTNMNFNGVIFLAMFGGMVIPVILILGTVFFINGNLAQSLFIIGINSLIALASPLWIKNIEKRMNQRKYINLDGFRNSLH